MNLILFFFIIIISLFIVRIGAVAFQVTGIEWSLAKFQALSCFTSTGFTTKEAELIVSNMQRRKIATVLMVLGNAGFVILIATFANSMRAPSYFKEVTIPYFNIKISGEFFPWINLVVISVLLYVGFKILTKTKIPKRITARIKKRLKKTDFINAVSYEEIVVATGGYGLINIQIDEKSPVLNKTISESGLRDWGIVVLMIERDDTNYPVPRLNTKILLGDNLVCFGQLERAKEELLKAR